VQFVLLAELEPVTVPSNLSITDVEYKEAIQFFRSALDPATIQGDNPIALIAGKNTVARMYVDTGIEPSLPTIASDDGQFPVASPCSVDGVMLALSASPGQGSVQVRRRSRHPARSRWLSSGHARAARD
jgi:hypothetical protein